jgi:Tudor domain
LSVFKNPTQFWLTKMKRMDDLMASMQRTYSGTPDSLGNTVQINDLCAVKTPADGRWCRGVIVKVTASDSVDVLLADSGHWVSVGRSNLRPLLAQHGAKPLQVATWIILQEQTISDNLAETDYQ